MKIQKAIPITSLLLSLVAVPAMAHTGSHGEALIPAIMHWLTSPTHALLTVIGSIAVMALALKIMARKIKNSRT